MKAVLPYFDSEWSFAQFRIPDTRTIAAFTNDASLLVISYEGNYHLASFDPTTSGDCQAKKQLKFFTAKN